MAQVKIVTQTITLPNSQITAYEARPENNADLQAGLVLVQEIFGVNHHIRRVCDDYAKLGFWVVSVAYFDHVEKNVELPYNAEGMKRGMELMQKVTYPVYTTDTIAAGEYVKAKLAELKDRKRRLGIIGYCLGGSMTWTMATQTRDLFQAGSSYYGSMVINSIHAIPNFPVIFHFGKKDHHIPIKKVLEFQVEHSDLPVHIYDADHGFNCDERSTYDEKSARDAFVRTLSFFQRYLNIKF